MVPGPGPGGRGGVRPAAAGPAAADRPGNGGAVRSGLLARPGDHAGAGVPPLRSRPAGRMERRGPGPGVQRLSAALQPGAAAGGGPDCSTFGLCAGLSYPSGQEDLGSFEKILQIPQKSLFLLEKMGYSYGNVCGWAAHARRQPLEGGTEPWNSSEAVFCPSWWC